MPQAGLSEVLENFSQEYHVRLEILVVKVPKVLTFERLPDCLRVGVVVIRYALSLELAVKGLLWREGGLLKAGPCVHVLVRVVPFLQEKLAPGGVLFMAGHDCEGL